MCSPIVKRCTRIFLGAVCLLAQGFLSILILPVMCTFRTAVILLAKLFQPDFDEILGGLSAIFACDLLTNATPRSTVIATLVFENQLSCEAFKYKVVERWIEGEDNRRLYKRLQQYPVKWLGFCFWKNAFDHFSIDKHVYRVSGKETVINEELLEQHIERLLNGRFETKKSPWEFHIIENYQSGKQFNNHSNGKTVQSVVLFRFHHTLGDGFSTISAVTRLYDNQSNNPFHFPQPNSSRKRARLIDKLRFGLMLPVNTLVEGSVLLSNLFTSCPWRVPDEKKKWHQLVARADPIPLETVKTIKNRFNVGFTTVLLSAVSSSIYNNLEIVHDHSRDQASVLCLNVLPIPSGRSQNNLLENKLAAVILDIPKGYYGSPLERLRAVDRMLQSKGSSIVPFMSQIMPKLTGSLALPVCRPFAKNRAVPFALSNVPGLPSKYEFNGIPNIDNDFHLGGGAGVAGVVISALGHHQNLRISITAEEGLMSKAEAQQFVSSITDEIRILYEITSSA